MAVTAGVDTVQGVIEGGPQFHLDTSNDVLYLRWPRHASSVAYGEESPDGFTVMRTPGGEVAGVTVVNYWRDFGDGALDAASIRTIREHVASWARQYRGALGEPQ